MSHRLTRDARDTDTPAAMLIGWARRLSSIARRSTQPYDAVMDPVKKLMSWWRGPTDPETLAREAEEQRMEADRQTIKLSQGMTGKGTSASLLSAPTPDVLHPGSDESRKSH